MNNERREKLGKIIHILDTVKDELEDIRGEEEEACDNTPENLQFSERYGNSEYAIEKLDDALAQIEECLNAVEEASGC